jgi:hypothetical protein
MQARRSLWATGRYPRKLLENAVGLPALVLMLFFMRGRRPPDLTRIPGHATFQERRAAAVAWVEGQFQLIESALLWLDRPGVAVEDGCWASRAARGWIVQHSDPWYVSCSRSVTAVYGASGDAAAQLSELADAVGAAGWGCYGFPDPVARLRELLVMPFQEQGLCSARPGWRARAGVVPPPAARHLDKPHATEPSVHMSIQAERGQQEPEPAWPPAGRHRLRDLKRSAPSVVTPVHQPVESSEADVATLAEREFAVNDHVFAITISIYYAPSGKSRRSGLLSRKPKFRTRW